MRLMVLAQSIWILDSKRGMKIWDSECAKVDVFFSCVTRGYRKIILALKSLRWITNVG
jgi:hypothetical protein